MKAIAQIDIKSNLEIDRRATNMQKSNATIRVDTAENWEKAKKYIPDVFTIIVYEFADAAPKIKIGDGVHTVGSLPFLVQREVSGDILAL